MVSKQEDHGKKENQQQRKAGTRPTRLPVKRAGKAPPRPQTREKPSAEAQAQAQGEGQQQSPHTRSGLNWDVAAKHSDYAKHNLPSPDNSPVSSVHEAIARDFPASPFPSNMIRCLFHHKEKLGVWQYVVNTETTPCAQQDQQQSAELQRRLKLLRHYMNRIGPIVLVAKVKLIPQKDYTESDASSNLVARISFEKDGAARCDIFLVSYKDVNKAARLGFQQGNSFKREISLRDATDGSLSWLAERLFGFSEVDHDCFVQAFRAVLSVLLLTETGAAETITRESLLKEIRSCGL